MALTTSKNVAEDTQAVTEQLEETHGEGNVPEVNTQEQERRSAKEIADEINAAATTKPQTPSKKAVEEVKPVEGQTEEEAEKTAAKESGEEQPTAASGMQKETSYLNNKQVLKSKNR